MIVIRVAICGLNSAEPARMCDWTQGVGLGKNSCKALQGLAEQSD